MEPLLTYHLILITAAIIMIAAAVSDLVRFKIPNSAVLALLLLFPLLVFVSPVPVVWQKHLLVFGIVLAVGYVLYARKIAGAGDIKMIAAVALWAGPDHWGLFLFITALAGGILGLTVAVIAQLRQQLTKKKEEQTISQKPIPYGVAIALGGLCTLALLSSPALLVSKG